MSGRGNNSTFQQSTVSTVCQKYEADLLVFPLGCAACHGHARKTGPVWSHESQHLTSRESNRNMPSGGAEVSVLARSTFCLLEVPCRPRGTTLTDLEWREKERESRSPSCLNYLISDIDLHIHTHTLCCPRYSLSFRFIKTSSFKYYLKHWITTLPIRILFLRKLNQLSILANNWLWNENILRLMMCWHYNGSLGQKGVKAILCWIPYKYKHLASWKNKHFMKPSNCVVARM